MNPEISAMMTLDEIHQRVLELFGIDAEIGEDDDGQLIIHTGINTEDCEQ